MKNTLIVLGILTAGVIGLEIVALLDPNDNWWTITSVFRLLPCWAITMIMTTLGALISHFYWK